MHWKKDRINFKWTSLALQVTSWKNLISVTRFSRWHCWVLTTVLAYWSTRCLGSRVIFCHANKTYKTLWDPHLLGPVASGFVYDHLTIDNFALFTPLFYFYWGTKQNKKPQQDADNMIRAKYRREGTILSHRMMTIPSNQ